MTQPRCRWCRDILDRKSKTSPVRFCGKRCRAQWSLAHRGYVFRYRKHHPYSAGIVGWGKICEITGKSRTAIRGWISHGMPITKHNGHRAFNIEDVMQWVAVNTPQRQRMQFSPTRIVDDPLESGVIYAICDPVTHEVRYIGKTINLRRRKARYKSDPHNEHLKRLITKWSRLGREPEFKTLETCLLGLCEAERKWIAEGRAKGWKLCNVLDGGGSGRRTTDEHKERMSIMMKARWAARRESHMQGIAYVPHIQGVESGIEGVAYGAGVR